MFNFKTIPKHHFLDGSPFWCVSQREYGYIDEETGQISIPFDYTTTITNLNTDYTTSIAINSPEGDIIFEPLTTEERVREIFREEYYNILREDIENVV